MLFFVLFFGNVVLKIFYYPPPHLSLSIVESYTLTELSDVALPPDTPSTSISIDDLSPISPSNHQPLSTRQPSTTPQRSIKALKRWLSSPVRRFSLGGGGKSQSSKAIQSPEGSSYMFLPLSPAQSPLSPMEKSNKLPHSYRSLVWTSFTIYCSKVCSQYDFFFFKVILFFSKYMKQK